MTEFTQLYLTPKIFLMGSSLAFSLKEDPVRCSKVCDKSHTNNHMYSCYFHVGVWDGPDIVGPRCMYRAPPIQHIGDWPNYLDCTQCGASRDAELCPSVT